MNDKLSDNAIKRVAKDCLIEEELLIAVNRLAGCYSEFYSMVFFPCEADKIAIANKIEEIKGE